MRRPKIYGCGWYGPRRICSLQNVAVLIADLSCSCLCHTFQLLIESDASGRLEAGVCTGLHGVCLTAQRRHCTSAAPMLPGWFLQEQQAADAACVTALMSEQSAALQQRAISLERERDVAESTAQARPCCLRGHFEVTSRFGRNAVHVQNKGLPCPAGPCCGNTSTACTA